MIEWWYVPGVSTSRRRRSGWDGFASSSSWNTVRIPKRLPRTAKLATAATAAPPAPARGGGGTAGRGRGCAPQLDDAAKVAGAEQRERRHHERLHDEDRDPGLEER